MKINLPQGIKVTEEEKKQMRKEGEIKRNQNFDKLTGIFGEPEKRKEHKEGKVFEYHEKDEEENELEDIDYSHAHLEEFMKSLNEHNKNNSFKKKEFATVSDHSNDLGNSTLNPEQTDNLITNFLSSVATNQNPPRRAGSEIASITSKIAPSQTGATLSNSLAYSQTN
jgi:hypothetical protein